MDCRYCNYPMDYRGRGEFRCQVGSCQSRYVPGPDTFAIIERCANDLSGEFISESIGMLVQALEGAPDGTDPDFWPCVDDALDRWNLPTSINERDVLAWAAWQDELTEIREQHAA